MCDPRIYTRYRCADPVTGLCVCDVNGPYASKEGCEKSWQCHLNQLDPIYEHRSPSTILSRPEEKFSSTFGAKTVTNLQGYTTEPTFYVQQ